MLKIGDMVRTAEEPRKYGRIANTRQYIIPKGEKQGTAKTEHLVESHVEIVKPHILPISIWFLEEELMPTLTRFRHA